MKTFPYMYTGMVIDNNDPEYRGRIQVFIPHIMPTLYEGWNKEGADITITCVGDNIPQGLTTEIAEKLKKILPWAEAASPIVGQSIPGGTIQDFSQGGSNGEGGGALNFDQTPTTIPAGTFDASTTCNLPTEGSNVDIKNLKPKFSQRLNAFYDEAAALGYNITCSSGYRSYQKQAALFAEIGQPGCAPPGGSTHEFGIAVDIKVTGLGVSITQISTKADILSNKDTPEFRALLAKYGLHQPLHPDNHPSGPEKWHIEPIESPKAGGPRGPESAQRVASLMSDIEAAAVAETTSGSQFPAAANPLTTKSPTNTDISFPTAPTTGLTLNTSNTNNLVTGAAGTIVNSGPNSGLAASAEGGSQLAKDRISRFEGELSDRQLLDRIEYVTNKEGGASGRLILETAVNRAFFGNKTLKETLFQKAYYKDAGKDPGADKTTPYTSYTINQIKSVIYGGSNETNLATDQAYNDKKMFAKLFIDAGATGDWFNLSTGQKITDPTKIIQLSNNPGSGNEEFIYRKDGHGDARSTAGLRARAYADTYNISSSSNFNSDAPLPEKLQDASKSSLTNKPLNQSVDKPPVTVNNTDPHGPTVVKNTNDAAKGMFAFPGVGAMVWVFFREGNPQFPVYFAASYSSTEWKSAYNSPATLNPEGTNIGNAGTQLANSMRLNPNAGGGLEFTHVKDGKDPSGSSDKAVAMMYGDDGSNMLFSKGYHQIYTRHDRRNQIDGHLYNIIGGSEEKWVEGDSSVNVRGNVLIKIGKVDIESIEAMRELADFSKQLNDTLMSNSGE